MSRHLFCLLSCIYALGALTLAQQDTGGLSAAHTEIPRWCGKPYEAGSPNFEPGGRLDPPTPGPSSLLDVRLQPLHSIYDSSEKSSHLIVDASVSRLYGQPFSDGEPNSFLVFNILELSTNRQLAASRVQLGSRGNLVDFNLTLLKPRMEPYAMRLSGTFEHDSTVATYTADSELYYLPAKNTGSTVKIDNLNGGMLVANNATGYKFQPLLPFGFYTSCSGYLNFSAKDVTTYKDLGFNAINPVCALSDGVSSSVFDWLDASDLWYQYDMRNSYRNLSSVMEQIPLIKDRSNLLTWYTADEPDGWQHALNSTKLAYDLLKREDPYHPTALVLNCDNYYFRDYASGADLIMQDAYPVGIDPNFSRKFNTTCNETYGDCGCDNCIGSLHDVSLRLETYINYQNWLDDVHKPLWSVLQAFSGESYWERDPTPAETWAMMILSFNHNAKGVMSWQFPTSDVLREAHGRMARLVTSSPVRDFVLGGNRSPLVGNRQLDSNSVANVDIDVASWSMGSQLMVMLANVESSSQNETIVVKFPQKVSKVISQPWGNLSYSLHNDHELVATNVDGSSTSILILDLNI